MNMVDRGGKITEPIPLKMKAKWKRGLEEICCIVGFTLDEINPLKD